MAYGGYFNVSPEFVTYEVRIAGTEQLVSSFGADVRPNVMTTVLVFPGEY